MESFSAVAFLGAMAIFMYGIRLSRIGVQLLAGDRLQSLITSLTKNRITAVVTGMLITMILQSSTATTAMLVNFARTGVITLEQAMGVTLGAGIGTTLVVILLSLKNFRDSALLLLIIGVGLELFSKRKKMHSISMVMLGFGFVFFGMHLMIETTSPLQSSALLAQIFNVLGTNPPYAFCAAIVLTALVQNSAVTLGLTIALAFAKVLNLYEAMPLVLGANVGTCIGALLQSIGGGAAAKRVAFSHLLLKTAGAIIALSFLGRFTDLVSRLALFISASWSGYEVTLPAKIALAHVLFNVLLVAIFLPLITPGARLVEKIIPQPYQPEDQKFGAKSLDPQSLETPALAFANAKREILRMAEIALEMFSRIMTVFEKNDEDLLAYIEEQDDKVDILNHEIKFYLAKISQEALNAEQAKTQLNLVSINSDLEETCDVISRDILDLASKKMKKRSEFSVEGWSEIKNFYEKVSENFQLMISCLTLEDETIGRKIMRHEKHLAELETRYREAHLLRLNRGLKESIETSSIHLELLANFRRIDFKLASIVKLSLPYKDL